MNFFVKIGSWITGFFKSDLSKKILNLGLEILKITAGDAAEKLHKIAKEEVIKAEDAGEVDKYTLAFKGIVSRLKYEGKSIVESEVNLAIEIAVSALKKELEG